MSQLCGTRKVSKFRRIPDAVKARPPPLSTGILFTVAWWHYFSATGDPQSADSSPRPPPTPFSASRFRVVSLLILSRLPLATCNGQALDRVTKQKHHVRKLFFQPLWTIFGHFRHFRTFSDILSTFPFAWAVQRCARYSTRGLWSTEKSDSELTPWEDSKVSLGGGCVSLGWIVCEKRNVTKLPS